MGFTTLSMRARLLNHIAMVRFGKKTHVCHWIRQLMAFGIKPIPIILEIGIGSKWKDSECRWIRTMRARGEPLTNHTDGGEGRIGHSMSDATRAKLMAAHIGKPLSVETRKKISRALTGRVYSPETIAKWTGRKHKPESIEKMRLAKLGNKYTLGHKASPETCAKFRGNTYALGSVRSPETRNKLRLAQIGRKRTSPTPAAIAKMQEARRVWWQRRKRIVCTVLFEGGQVCSTI